MDFKPSRTYDGLLVQARAMQAIINGNEITLAGYRERLAALSVDRHMEGAEQLQAERDTNQRLTNRVEELEDTVQAYREAAINRMGAKKEVTDVTLSISRSSNSNVYIEVQDEASRVKFLKCEISLEDFAMLITGGRVQASATLKQLDAVGKRKETERREALCPLGWYDTNADLEKWLVDNCQEDGWIIDSYLRSQDSVKRVDGGTLLRYNVYRYV